MHRYWQEDRLATLLYTLSEGKQLCADDVVEQEPCGEAPHICDTAELQVLLL